MPIDLSGSAPTVLIRRSAYERADLSRAAIDAALNLTPDEFRVEGGLIAIGPIHDADAVPELIEQLESAGLVYFDDFIEVPGNWPSWMRMVVAEGGGGG